jgi:hypothetical protein
VLREADPAEVVDDERGDRLPGEDERHERDGAEARGGDDAAEYLEGAQETADFPNWTGSMAPAATAKSR